MTETTMNPQQCRMARAALNLGVRDLAKIADVAPNTIARLERGERLHARTMAHVQGALEALDVIFIDSHSLSAGGGGAGIRIGKNIDKSIMGKLFEPPGVWQPIETAPRDGTLILAYKKDRNEFFEYCIVKHIPERGGFKGWGFDMKPTHWMRLPGAP